MKVSNRISTFFETLINLILWLFIIPVYSIPLFLGFTLRFLINFIVSWKDGRLTPLSPNDILLVRGTPEEQPVCNGGFILKVKGHLELSQLQDQFYKLFLTHETEQRHSNLYCDLVKRCGYLYKRKLDHLSCWRDSLFSKRNCEDEIEYEVTSWFQEQWGKGLPLWGFLVINDERKDESWVCFKGHHAFMDGYSFAYILNVLCHINKDVNNVGTNQNASVPVKMWDEVKLLFTLPLITLRYLLRHFWNRDILSTYKLPKLTDIKEVMPMSYCTVELDVLKTLRRKMKVRFPSIVYSLQVGALKRFLNMREDKLENRNILVSTSLPVEESGGTGEGMKFKGLRNYWSGGTIRIPTCQSPLKRLMETDHDFLKVTDNSGPYLIWRWISWIPYLFPVSMNYSMSFSNLSLYRYRTQMSCIRQDEENYYLFGKFPVINILHAPMMKDSFPQAVLLGCSSTHGSQVDFSFFGHPDLFKTKKEMDKLVKVYFKEELDQVLAEAGTSTP